MMDHAQIRERLDDFVDGALSAGESRAVRAHLDACSACREEMEALLSLLADARALPREVRPPRDLWPEIAARLRDRQVIGVDFPPRRVARPWLPLAAAAVALVALSSGLTLFLMGRAVEAPVTLAPAPAAPPARPATALAAFAPAETELLGTVETLQAALAARRDQLQPSTVATIEENLRIVDRAIAEARAALEADPGNPALPHLLSGVYRKKVELLESAIRIPIQS